MPVDSIHSDHCREPVLRSHGLHPDPGGGRHPHRLSDRIHLRHPPDHPLHPPGLPGQALCLKAHPGAGPGVCGGLPGDPHDPPGGVHLLRPALLHLL